MEHARVRFGKRGGIGAALGGPEVECDKGLGLPDRSADAIDHRHAEFGLELSRHAGHSGAAEHDGFRPVLGEGKADLRAQALGGAGGRIFKGQDRNVRGPDLATGGHAIALDQRFDGHARALQRRDDGETLRHEGGKGDRGLADAENGNAGHGAGSVEPCVVETGDDGSVRSACLAFGNGEQQPRHRKRLVIVAFDRGRPHGRGDGHDLGVGGSGVAGGGSDGRRHGRSRVWVDHQKTHRVHLRLAPAFCG